jgi:dihydrofolate reductase
VNIKIIVAMASNRVISQNGKIPWHCSEDLQNFKKLTMGHCVIVGRTTWETLPPLKGRRVIVLSHDNIILPTTSTTRIAKSIPEALGMCYGSVWVAGGANVYEQFIPIATHMYITYIHNVSIEEGDLVTFPVFDPDRWKVLRASRHRTHSFIVMARRSTLTDLLM